MQKIISGSKALYLVLAATMLPWTVAVGTEIMPTKVVLFPYRRAVIPSLVDSVITKYNVKEGETFTKGQVIAHLDDRNYRQIYEKAMAAERENKANCIFAEQNYKSTLELFNKGFKGKEELNKNKLELEIAKSKLESAVANRRLGQLQLDACTIRAPFPGRLVKKIINTHEYVRTGQAFMSIIDDNQILAVMHLPSNRKNVIKTGNKIKITVDETKTMHSGTVYEISGEVDPGSRTFETKALVNNSSHKLTAGMSGKLVSCHPGDGK
jgi:membrane fusion protein, multidrug efflux system